MNLDQRDHPGPLEALDLLEAPESLDRYVLYKALCIFYRMRQTSRFNPESLAHLERVDLKDPQVNKANVQPHHRKLTMVISPTFSNSLNFLPKAGLGLVMPIYSRIL